MAKEVRREVTKPAVSMAGGGKPKDDHRSILFCIGYGGRMRSIVVRQGSMRERKTENREYKEANNNNPWTTTRLKRKKGKS